MADYTFRGNLNTAQIPADPLLFGRSIVVRDRDQNYSPNVASRTDKDKDAGIPQVMYVSNALPTESGFRSVAYFGSQERCPGVPYLAFPVRSTAENATFVHTEDWNLFRLRKPEDPEYTPEFAPMGNFPGVVTYAHVAGVTYIFFAGHGCYTYDFSTNSLVPETLSGLDATQILGITATGGYLLAWSADAIAWSSLVDPTDFVPSLDTGAGGGSVEGAKGALTVCVSNSFGVYIFTEANCVSAQLSNNARYPFNFREIVGSSGIQSVQEVSYEGNNNTAYAFTSAGFQQISHNGAKTIWTDLYENALNTPKWTEATVLKKALAGEKLDGKIKEAKVVSITSRYVCISVRHRTLSHYTHCWVYDTSLDRWGMLLVDHLEVFEDEQYDIGIITADGRYLVVDSPFSQHEYRAESIFPYLALGRYQYSRARQTVMQFVDIENTYAQDLYDEYDHKYAEDVFPQVYLLASQNGKYGSFVEMTRIPMTQDPDDESIRYARTASGINHTLLLKGHFELNSIVITVSQGGAR